MRRPSWFPWVLVGIAPLCGCRNAFGPEPLPTTTVSGRVHLGDASVTHGWVEMMPGEGTLGRLRSAAIRSDGTFSAEKVPIGQIGIRISGADIPKTSESIVANNLPLLMRGHFIRRTVEAGGKTVLDLDLRKEAYEVERIRQERRLAAQPESVQP